MMLILGISDILAAGVLLLKGFGFDLPAIALIVAGLYLLVKLFIFPLNIAGVIDFVAGILILISFFVVLPKALVLIVAIPLLWKAIQGFLAHQ